MVANVESRVVEVTVFAHGAAVRRTATATATASGTIRIGGLPLAAIDDTVRVEVEGGPIAVAVRVGTDVSAEPAAEDSKELRAVRRREAIATAEVVRLETAIERLAQAPVIADDDSDEAPAAWTAVVAARRTLIEVRAERERTLREQLVAARRELDVAHREHELVAMHEALRGNAKDAKAHELRKHVELELVGSAAATGATIRLEYQVAAARWAPAYVARLERESTQFEMRAIVAQESGEDWTGVALRLSTAEPARFSPLPELAAQKIGRRQHEPARRGFRPAPSGSELLYADYERTFPRPVVPRQFGATARDDSTVEGFGENAKSAPEETFAAQVWDEDSSHAKGVYAEAPMKKRAGPLGAAQAAPSAARATTPLPGAPPANMQAVGELAAYGGGGPQKESRQRAEPVPAAPEPRLDYGNLVMAASSSPDRGKLVPAPEKRGVAGRVIEAQARIEQLALPVGHIAGWDHTYDYAFAGDGTVDVASDGAWHSVALTARAGEATMRHVAVPREQPDVFRVADVTNPFDGPLLPGPIDVYDRGHFLVTSQADYTPPGGRIEIGLGVDPHVKIARNAEFHEEAAGMLRGALRLVHAVTIELENVSPRPVDVEVRERIPVTREGDDDIEVTLGRVDPTWEAWAPEPDAPGTPRLRGGHRWRVTVAPAAKKLLRATYDVKIPSKTELVGGNRRES